MEGKLKLVLIVSILASGVAFLDGAIVNVALPAIQEDLGGGISAQQWIIDAYLLTLGSLILIAGSLSDLLGRKRILALGLWGFGLASVLCAVAPNSLALIMARGLQGASGALLVPSSLALIMSVFSGPSQGKAIGSWTAWTGISFVIGPLVGGLLIDYASWRWIFAINVVPIAITLWLLNKIDIADQKSKVKIDVLGATLGALGLGGTVFALIEYSRYGWNDPLIYIPLVGGIILLAAFLLYESRAKAPMLPLSLFNNRNFSIGNLSTVSIYAGLSAGTFLIPVFLQQVAGYSALAAGMALLPITIIMFLLSPRFGALAGRYGPRLFMGLGPLIAASGFLLMLNLQQQVNYATELLPTVLLFGLGLSLTVAPLTAAVLGDVPKTHSGIASAVNNAVARIAGLLAIAAVGVVLSVQFVGSLDSNGVPSDVVRQEQESPLQHPQPPQALDEMDYSATITEASVSAFHAGIVATAGLVALGGLVSLIGIRNPARELQG